MAVRHTARELPPEEVIASEWLDCARRAGRRWNTIPQTHARALPAATARCLELEADPVEFVAAFFYRYSPGWCIQKFKTPVVPMFALASPFADQILWEYRLHLYNQDLESESQRGALGDLVRKIEGESKRIAAMPEKIRETAFACGDVSSLWVALRLRAGLPLLTEADTKDREIRHDLKMLDSLSTDDLTSLLDAAHGSSTQARSSSGKGPRKIRDSRRGCG